MSEAKAYRLGGWSDLLKEPTADNNADQAGHPNSARRWLRPAGEGKSALHLGFHRRLGDRAGRDGRSGRPIVVSGGPHQLSAGR